LDTFYIQDRVAAGHLLCGYPHALHAFRAERHDRTASTAPTAESPRGETEEGWKKVEWKKREWKGERRRRGVLLLVASQPGPI
jgi:hypothetical protein